MDAMMLGMLGIVEATFAQWSAGLPPTTRATFRRVDDAYAPAAAVMAITTSERDVEVRIWDTGEADIVIGDVASGRVLTEHREISGESGVQQLFRDLVSALADR